MTEREELADKYCYGDAFQRADFLAGYDACAAKMEGAVEAADALAEQIAAINDFMDELLEAPGVVDRARLESSISWLKKKAIGAIYAYRCARRGGV